MPSIEAVMDVLTRMDLAGLAGAGARALSDDEKELRAMVYAEALSALSDEQLRAAGLLATRAASPFYPTPGQLLELVRPRALDLAEQTREATEEYRRVCSLAERGRAPNEREMSKPARLAYAAAGGNEAFSWCEPGRDEAFRLKRWMDAWMLSCEDEDAREKLLGAGASSPALSGSEAHASLSTVRLRARREEP